MALQEGNRERSVAGRQILPVMSGEMWVWPELRLKVCR
jgi:hypothetical protein